jgi:flagellar hook-length control protein FliK
MQNFSNISLLKALENSIATGPANSSGSFKDIPAPANSFDSILQNQLYNTKFNPNESISIDKNNNFSNTDKSYLEKPSEIPETTITPYNQQITDNNKIREDNKKIDRSGNMKEDFQKTENNEKLNKSKNIGEDDKTERKDKIKIKSERAADDISSLLRDINYILNMLKDLHFDKKQIREIKSSLSELKNALETKNNHLDKNAGIALNGHEFKRLLERLKSLLETANERAGLKNIKKFDGHNIKNAENIIDTSEIGGLKKQISKLVNEINQHLNHKKSESVITKNDESVNENKNLNNQKIFGEASAIEKNEGTQTRDNTSNFNLSNFKKDIEGAGTVSQKGTIPGAEKRNAFGDELNTIMQNAKLVVRDSKNGSFSIRLHPESLGMVNVNLKLEHGVIGGKFLVDSTEAKAALLENIQSVIDKLQENGISVGNFNVNVRDEKKSLFEYNEEAVSHIPVRKQPMPAGAEYELNSSYVHNGEIDMII